MKFRPLIVPTAAALLTGLFATGCGVELEGEEGELSFRYLGTDLVSGASSGTLATGARIDVELRTPGSDQSLPVREAVSEDSEVLEVLEVLERRFTLSAVAAGEARITAEALGADDEVISDSVSIAVADVDSVRLGVRCPDPVFVTDSRAQFSYRMYDASGSKLTGYGRFDVAVEPDTGGSVNEGIDQIEVLEIHTGSEAGSYELQSTVDDETFAFELVAPGDILFADIRDDDAEEVEHSVAVGSEAAVALFHLETGDATVCGPATAAIDLSVDSPEICEAEYRFVGDLHLLFVNGLSEGSCEVELQIPDTDISETFSVEVTP